MSQWTTPYLLLREELVQRRDEGVAIPDALRATIDELDPVGDAWNEPAVWSLYDELAALPPDAALAAREPDEFAGIRVLRPAGPRDLGWAPSERELVDRLHGAWTGRATGCALGKPVEIVGAATRNGILTGRADIKRYLQNRGDWPLRDYISMRDVGDGVELWCPNSTREHIAYMEADDDIHYSLAGLAIVEKHGPDFTWEHVARWWMSHIPVADICTAEVQALLNWMSRTARFGFEPGARSSATPQFCRTFRNPYREWIGAQIRADGWAWVCAGKPELAAEFAYRDACWTHTRNGIYGAMFFAAIEAAAFVEHDPARLVEIGLSEIPADCRLARAIHATLDTCGRAGDCESAMTSIEDLCNSMSPPVMNGIHTINNATLCVMALIFGRMDTLDAVTLSVMAGLDTDCNGATVGSVVGAAAGRVAFRNDLADRLHDTIRPNLIGFADITMTALAQRTAAQWHRVDAWHRDIDNLS